MNEQHSQKKKHFRIHPRIANVIILISILIIGFFIWSKHRGHFFAALPYFLLLLACPILHLLTHRGHKHKHYEDDQENKRTEEFLKKK